MASEFPDYRVPTPRARMHDEVAAHGGARTYQSQRFREEIVWADDAGAAILKFIEPERVDMTVMERMAMVGSSVH